MNITASGKDILTSLHDTTVFNQKIAHEEFE